MKSLFAFALVALTATPAFAQTCGKVSAGGKSFDFSPLHSDYVWNQVLSGNTYYLSACEDLVRPATTCADTSCIGYQVDGVGSCWCLGKASTATWSTYQGNPQVLYTGGSKRTTVSNSMVVTLMCSTTEVKPTAATENNFQYSFIWKTPAACAGATTPTPTPTPDGPTPTPGPSTGGGSKKDSLSGVAIFDILFFCSLAAFLIFGSIYNWKVKGESGVNVIPFKDFLKDIPFLVKDGFMFVFGVTKTTFYKLTGKTETI
eukprot:c17532_g1_i1.p1 GENE.c17532_g1_i1~~c17532_g1_i1.p1  ORF type:complete len:259 (+),score=47.86 c17532_g1_i1:62-838(+)